MKFLVDENLGKIFAEFLREDGHDVILVADVMKGEDDQKILIKARNENRVLITNDLDFGRLVFELKLPTNGVILFRTLTRNQKELFELIKPLLTKNLRGKFIAVREDKMRIQEL